MRPFEYVSPTTTKQVKKLLYSSWGESEILAGGTDLISLLKDEIVTPRRIVNIKEIKELQEIRYNAESGLRLGALVTVQELLEHRDVLRFYPALSQAAAGIHSSQIRNIGTVGGDLCQRPRCWYFRNGFGLLAKDKNGKSLVPEGDNRYHAILGNSGPAYFVSPSTLAPPLIALKANVRILGSKGERKQSLEKFFLTPQSDNQREYDLNPDEILSEILLPPPTDSLNATYEVFQKEALDWPLVTASVNLIMRRNRVRSARVVMGQVAPVPWLSSEAESALKRKKINEGIANSTGDAAVKNAKSLSQNSYKIQLAKVAVKRAILLAIEGGAS